MPLDPRSVEPRPRGWRPTSKRVGLVSSALGTLAGLAASWGGAYPSLASGHAATGVLSGEIVASTLGSLWLAALGAALWRDRRADARSGQVPDRPD